MNGKIPLNTSRWRKEEPYLPSCSAIARCLLNKQCLYMLLDNEFSSAVVDWKIDRAMICELGK